eukprot:Rhum_TRINITY_DN14385_c11_g1::Rhum_TRINITY_DN14385_c11_g1_i1::g.86105::m.86105
MGFYVLCFVTVPLSLQKHIAQLRHVSAKKNKKILRHINCYFLPPNAIVMQGKKSAGQNKKNNVTKVWLGWLRWPLLILFLSLFPCFTESRQRKTQRQREAHACEGVFPLSWSLLRGYFYIFALVWLAAMSTQVALFAPTRSLSLSLSGAPKPTSSKKRDGEGRGVGGGGVVVVREKGRRNCRMHYWYCFAHYVRYRCHSFFVFLVEQTRCGFGLTKRVIRTERTDVATAAGERGGVFGGRVGASASIRVYLFLACWMKSLASVSLVGTKKEKAARRGSEVVVCVVRSTRNESSFVYGFLIFFLGGCGCAF